ncbi:MAG: hypothetical protein ACRD29_02455 [Acidimicrobiales bacterium]
MATSEAARHRMYTALQDAIGHENATTLMEHLPPVGWADVATKRDLDHQSAMTDARLDALEHRIEALLHRELAALKGFFFWSMLASHATFAGLVVAAVKLI